MQRMLCAAAAALVLLSLSPAAAQARTHAFYRVKCAGPYCWPVAAPAPKRAGPRGHARMPARSQAQRWRHDVSSRRPGHGFSLPSPIRGEGGSREQNAGRLVANPAPIAIARRYLGGNPTGWPRVWCGAFMRLVMRAAGLPDLPSGDRAAAWARYGRASAPRPGAVVVWPHHVGLITAVETNGRATVISGNDGRRVRERVRSIAGAVVRMPG